MDISGSIFILLNQVKQSSLTLQITSLYHLIGMMSVLLTPMRQNASTSGQLKIVTVRNRGVGLGTANITYTRVPIQGDGTGGEAYCSY